MVTKIQIAGKLKFYSKPYGRQWKWRYQTHGHVMVPTQQIPKKLENVKIIDPLNLRNKEEEASKQPKWQPTRRHPLLEKIFFQEPKINDHPNFNEQPVKLFDRTCQFHAGIDQASLLTKTKSIQGLPSLIGQSEQNYTLSQNNDEIVKSYIKQALAFNPTKTVCPRLKIPHDVKFMIAREYATPQKEQMKILLDNLIRLCQMNINKKRLDSMTTRKIIQQSPLSTHINRSNDQLLIRRNNEFSIFSSKPQKALLSKDQIKEITESFVFKDMYPIFPTIDLKDEHIYSKNKNENTFGLNSNNSGKFSNLQSFFHVNDDQLNDEANISRLIMYSFGAAIAQAKFLNNKMNRSDHVLEKSIVINGISISNSQRLNFVMYQLNTLNLNENSGIKNVCYYDMGNELYLNRPTVDQLPYPTHKNIQRMAINKLEYNPDAFKKLQSILAYGV